MAATTNVVAIDKSSGEFSVDSNGGASYTIPLEVPPGIGRNNQPELYIRYSQSIPNGLTGQGWVLSGFSSITRAPRNRAVDGIVGPVTYNADGSRLALDGAELIVTAGQYGQADSKYTTQIQTDVTVTAKGSGTSQSFTATDYSGNVREFGTTTDSRALSTNHKYIREWYLKTRTDVHGNRVTYDHTTSPRLVGGGKGVVSEGMSYPDRISYTSNTVTGAAANRFVDFYYDLRTDHVVVTGAGDVIRTNYRLARIEVSINPGASTATPILVRAYNLSYAYSYASGSSQLIAVTEEGTDKSTLTPTTIEWASTPIPERWFQPANTYFNIAGRNADVVLSVLPLNITGKAFSDLAVVAYRAESKAVTVTSYLASIKNVDAEGNSTLDWRLSTHSEAISELPPIANNSIPAIMLSDLNGDGRDDLVVAYDSGRGLKFSVSPCTGFGFAPYQVVDTASEWSAGDSFFAMDCNGDGRTDILQVTSIGGYVAFRAYSSDYENGENYALGFVKEIWTNDLADNTLQWYPSDLNRDGVSDLVRTWYSDSPGDFVTIYATSYIGIIEPSKPGAPHDRIPTFRNMHTVALGTYPSADRRNGNIFVLPCDINADGVQDLVLCHLEQSIGSDNLLSFHFKSFFCDGEGGFTPAESRTLLYTVLGQNSKVTDTSFEIMDLEGSGIPSIVFHYRDWTGDYKALIVPGNYSGSLPPELTPATILNRDQGPRPMMSVIPADINGSGKAGWVAWTIAGGSEISVLPVYNTHPISDIVSGIQDPLGCRTEPEYRPLSLPSVYKGSDIPRQESQPVAGLWPSATALPNRGPFVPVRGSTQYVVSQYTNSNVSTSNAIDVSIVTSRYYEGAQVDLGGRGWQGFGKVYEHISEAISKSPSAWAAETYCLDYPFTGRQKSRDSYKAVTFSPETGFPSFKPDDWLSSVATTWGSQQSMYNDIPVYRVTKSKYAVDNVENGTTKTRLEVTYEYDDDGLLLKELTSAIDDYSKSTFKVFQKGKAIQYDTSGSLLGIPLYNKTSTVEANLDATKMSTFLTGDISLSRSTFDWTNYVVRQTDDWSSNPSHTGWVPTSFLHDPYGNQTQVKTAAGLTNDFTFDGIFHTYPILAVESGTGLANALQMSAAFDTRFGNQVATMEANGAVGRVAVDSFGRAASTSRTTLPVTNHMPPESLPPYLITTTAFGEILQTQNMTVQSTSTYGRTTTANGKNYLFQQRHLYNADGVNSTAKVVSEYIDCVGNVRREVTKQGTKADYWIYNDINSTGVVESQSIPCDFPDGTNISVKLAYRPAEEDCQVKYFDMRGQVIEEIQPRPASDKSRLALTTVYSNGGAKVITSSAAIQPGQKKPDSKILGMTTMTFGFVAGEWKLQTTTDENNLTTTFHYDKAGRLSESVDPMGKKDVQTNSLQGLLLSTDNVYQNPTRNTNGAVQLTYDQVDRVKTRTDVLGNITTMGYDCKGRTTYRKGSDDRTIRYVYDETPFGKGKLTSATVSKSGSPTEVESGYVFTYNALGQLVTRAMSVTLAGIPTVSSTLSYQYDLQDQMTNKTFPNNSVATLSYEGSLLVSSSLSEKPLSPTWGVAAAFKEHDKFDNCNLWQVETSGALLGSGTTWGTATYNNLNCNTIRGVFTGSEKQRTWKAKETCTFDPLSRIDTTTDDMTNTSTTYGYLSKRLHSSISGSVSKTFAYDNSGNLLGKGGLTFSFGSQNVVGKDSSNTEVIAVTYDNCGRMSTRKYKDKTLTYAYDGFDKIWNVTNDSNQSILTVLNDCAGSKIAEVRSNETIIHVAPDYTIHLKQDGSTSGVDHQFIGPGGVLGTVSTTTSASPASSTAKFTSLFTNNKGNVVATFDQTGTPLKQLAYDEFGMLLTPTSSLTPGDLSVTYESQSIDASLGLYDFGARRYDAVLGRFNIPDSRWSNAPTVVPDVFNRYAFENNDPINSTDATGHLSGSAVGAIVIGVALVVVGVAIIVGVGMLTGGVGLAPGMALACFAMELGASAVGGMFTGAGWASISFAIANSELDGADFWSMWGYNVLVGGGTGFVLGLAGPFLTAARMGAAASTLFQGIKAKATGAILQRGMKEIFKELAEKPTWVTRLIGYPTSAGANAAFGLSGAVLEQLGYNGITGVDDLSEGIWQAAVSGACFGLLNPIGEGAGEWKVLAEVSKTQPITRARLAAGIAVGGGQALNAQLFGRLADAGNVMVATIHHENEWARKWSYQSSDGQSDDESDE